MKKFSAVICLLGLYLMSFSFSSKEEFRVAQGDNVEFVCMKKHAASKTCHYNFKVDGAKFRYVDIGCQFRKKDEVIEKVKVGDLALAKDWKVVCPEPKPEAGN